MTAKITAAARRATIAARRAAAVATLPDRMLTGVEAAAFLGVSERTLARLDVPKVHLSIGRVGFPLSELKAWVARRTVVNAA